MRERQGLRYFCFCFKEGGNKKVEGALEWRVSSSSSRHRLGALPSPPARRRHWAAWDWPRRVTRRRVRPRSPRSAGGAGNVEREQRGRAARRLGGPKGEAGRVGGMGPAPPSLPQPPAPAPAPGPPPPERTNFSTLRPALGRQRDPQPWQRASPAAPVPVGRPPAPRAERAPRPRE